MMAKVVRVPRLRSARASGSLENAVCAFKFDGTVILFDCTGCAEINDAPSDLCLTGFHDALKEHPETNGIRLLGTEHVWIRGKGLDSMLSLISAEGAWSDFCHTIRSLPCRRPLPSDRLSGYLEKVGKGYEGPFCSGDGVDCQDCLRSQELALRSLSSDRRRARRAVATDRFRITEVLGGEGR